MVKTWVVKTKGRKATLLRREPDQDHTAANAMRIVKNGETVAGDFMYVRRASREVGFIKVRHLEQQCGNSFLVRNDDNSTTTLIRKQPTEVLGEANTVGYAAEGEMLTGEWVFVRHKDERRGGYIKFAHLRAKADDEDDPAVRLAAFDGASMAQRWAVLDAVHDGAWLRRAPNSDRSERNLLGLVPNGTVVAGEFVHVRRAGGEAGFARFRDLEQLSPKAWRVRTSKGALAKIELRREPRESEARAVGESVAVMVPAGEQLTGEYVFVTTGRKVGFVKRNYLTGLSTKPSAEASTTSGSRSSTAERPLVVS